MHNLIRLNFIKKIFLLSLVLGFLNLMSMGQNDLSLEQLVTQAIEENYQIRILRNLEQTAENQNTIGQAGMLPVVDFNGEARTAINNSQQQFFTGDTQEATNASRRSTNASLDASWIVFDGFSMFARKDQLDQLSALSRADTRFLIEQTVADLSVLYFQLRQASKLLEAYRQSMKVSAERLVYEERAVEVGASTFLDLKLAQVDYNTDSSLVLNQQLQLSELAVSINRIIRRDLTLPVVPTDSLILSEAIELDVLIEQAYQNNSSLNQQHLNELIAISESKAVRGDLFPQVELFGSYGFDRQANEIGFLQSSRTFGPEYGIRVRFNLFSGYQTKTATQNADILIENEEIRLEDLELEVEESLRIAFLRWEYKLKQVYLEQESVQAATEALAIARQQYELGTITNIEFRVIQLNVINARTRFLDAQFQAKLQEIELMRVSGNLI